jgi:hypothetical protein
MATGVILLFLVAATPLVATTARIAWQSRAKVVNVADKSATNAKASLANAKAAGAKVEFAVRFGAISIGWLAFCIGASRWVLSEADWPVQFFSLMPLWPLGGALMLLSVRPTDKIATFVATPLVQLATLYFGVQLTGAFFLFIRSGAGAVAFPFLLIGGTNIVCGLLLIRNYCVCPGFDKAGSPRVRLNRLWRSYRIFCGAMTPFFFFAAAANAGLLPPPSVPANDPTAASPPPSQPPGRDGGDFTKAFSSSSPTNPADAPGAFLCVLVTLLIAAGLKPAVRRRFHAFLGSLAVQGESKAAATVAGLVGGRSPDEALKHGASTFRGLPFGSLSVNDFKTNTDTGLHAKTVKASLGEVDAFLSHSWHDDADQKWGALEKWSGDKGKTSTVWLDKVLSITPPPCRRRPACALRLQPRLYPRSPHHTYPHSPRRTFECNPPCLRSAHAGMHQPTDDRRVSCGATRLLERLQGASGRGRSHIHYETLGAHPSREPIAQPDSLPAACAPCLFSLIPKRVRMGTFPPLFPAFSA